MGKIADQHMARECAESLTRAAGAAALLEVIDHTHEPRVATFTVDIETELTHGCTSDCHHAPEYGEWMVKFRSRRDAFRSLVDADGMFEGYPVTHAKVRDGSRVLFEWGESEDETLSEAVVIACRTYDPAALRREYLAMSDLTELHLCPLCGCPKDQEPEFANAVHDCCDDAACICHQGEEF